MLTDSHCHLDRLGELDLDQALSEARQRGVNRFLCIAIDQDNTQSVVDIANRYPDVYATAGVHPMHVHERELDPGWLSDWARQGDVVALGETGLDYHYAPDSAAQQKDSFALHLQLGGEVGKPVIVHTRNARQDTLDLIRDYGCRENAGVLHCFTEDWAMAKAALDLNYYISISGIVTFPRADELRDVVRKLPQDRLLIETDSPYLAPVPYRGKTNQPAYVKEVAQCCADLLGMSLEQLGQQTSDNFDRLFPLATPATL